MSLDRSFDVFLHTYTLASQSPYPGQRAALRQFYADGALGLEALFLCPTSPGTQAWGVLAGLGSTDTHHCMIVSPGLSWGAVQPLVWGHPCLFLIWGGKANQPGGWGLAELVSPPPMSPLSASTSRAELGDFVGRKPAGSHSTANEYLLGWMVRSSGWENPGSRGTVASPACTQSLPFLRPSGSPKQSGGRRPGPNGWTQNHWCPANGFFSCLCPPPPDPSVCSTFPLCVSLTPQHKSVLRSYSQGFVPPSQASGQPFLPPTSSSSSPHFPPVHQSQSSDLEGPTAAGLSSSTMDGPLSASQESTFPGNAACRAPETSPTASPLPPPVRTQRCPLPVGCSAPGWAFVFSTRKCGCPHVKRMG